MLGRRRRSLSVTPAAGQGTENGPGETWSGIQALGWIATRCRDFVGGLRVAFAEDAEGALATFRLGHSLPDPQNGDWPRYYDGTVAIFNIDEFHASGMSFSSAAVTGLWPEYAETRAWKLARSMPLKRPKRAAASWRKRLPAREALGLADVINAVTPNSNSPSTNPRRERAAQLSFCVALLEAVAERHVKLFGVPCERPRNDRPDQLRRPNEERIAIEPEVAATLAPVLNGRSDWLGRSEYADNFALDGNAPHSVCFCDVLVERESLVRWLSNPSGKRLTAVQVEEILKRLPLSMAIDNAVTMVQEKDPGWPRDAIRKFARKVGIQGKRGRPPKKSAEEIAREN